MFGMLTIYVEPSYGGFCGRCDTEDGSKRFNAGTVQQLVRLFAQWGGYDEKCVRVVRV